MAYIGKAPVNGFHSKQTLSTDGSTVTFTLDFTVADETSIIVSVGGVLQEPKVAYNLAGGGTQITFTAAPASTDTAYIQYLGQAIVQTLLDVNGAEFILDVDADTSFTADTDDEIDIKVGGTDRSTIKTTGFHNVDSYKFIAGTGDDLEIYHDGTNSYVANKTGALKIATETSGIAVTIGHTTSEVTVADNMTVTGDLTVTGTANFGDTNITNVGSITLDSILNDGTDITLDSSNDIVIDAAGGNIEFKDAGTLQLTLDMDGTAGAQVIQLGVDSDDLVFNQYDGNEVVRMADDRRLYFFDKGGEYIAGDGANLTIVAGTDIVLSAGADINIPANIGLTFGDDGEKIEGDGTDLTISGNNINLTAVADVNIPSGVGLTFATTEKIESDGTDLSITVGSNGDINIPANIGLTFGDDGEKIEGDGTDLTIAGNNINLTAVADVVIPTNVGLHFTDANEKIESNGTDLTINSGADINLTATADVNIPSGVGLTFGDDGEKIEGDGTDLTIAGNNIKLTAAADVIIPTNIGLHFTDANEKIESDGTDLTINSGAKINLTATSDVHIPNDVGIVFGGDSEKIEGDGTDMTISANNLTVDAAADITLDAGGNDFKFSSGGTQVLNIANSSSDVIVKPVVDAKDLIFQQRDGTEVFRVEDGAYMSLAATAVNPEATLTDASTVSWNGLTSPVAAVTLGGNRTLAAASGVITGQFLSILFIQDGTGSRTISFNAAYEHTGDVAPVLTTTANKGDLFVYRYNGAKFLEVGRNLNLTLS